MNKIKRLKILIIKLSSLGDIIHTLHIPYSIKYFNPNIYIGWVVSRKFKYILDDNPYIDKLFIFERDKWGGVKNFFKYKKEIWNLIKDIRKERFDIVLDFQGLLRSGLLTLLSGGKIKAGFKESREFAYIGYNIKVDANHIKHVIDKYSYLLKQITNIPIKKKFYIKTLKKDYLIKKFKISLDNKFVISIIPGTRWVTKRWIPLYFVELIEKIKKDKLIIKKIKNKKIIIILLGGKSDIELGKYIENKLEPNIKNNYFYNLIGKTNIIELNTILSYSNLLIGSDTGPLHIGSALNIPIIGIFGPTPPERTGPFSSKSISCIPDNIECSPCFKKECNDIKCMKNIKPDKVIENIYKII